MESLKIWTEAAQCMTQRENRQKNSKKLVLHDILRLFSLIFNTFFLTSLG